MPLYDYEHDETPCEYGKVFEWSQPMASAKLEFCPNCGGPVHRLVSLCAISTPKTNSDLKGMGFTKLVRRDDGVYENVTATGSESKVWDKRKPETMPDFKAKISD
ncbi:MAG: zinc ribbon domain-containing protein [Thermodesulfobacteriota bacterium]